MSHVDGVDDGVGYGVSGESNSGLVCLAAAIVEILAIHLIHQVTLEMAVAVIVAAEEMQMQNKLRDHELIGQERLPRLVNLVKENPTFSSFKDAISEPNYSYQDLIKQFTEYLGKKAILEATLINATTILKLNPRLLEPRISKLNKME